MILLFYSIIIYSIVCTLGFAFFLVNFAFVVGPQHHHTHTRDPTTGHPTHHYPHALHTTTHPLHRPTHTPPPHMQLPHTTHARTTHTLCPTHLPHHHTQQRSRTVAMTVVGGEGGRKGVQANITVAGRRWLRVAGRPTQTPLNAGGGRGGRMLWQQRGLVGRNSWKTCYTYICLHTPFLPHCHTAATPPAFTLWRTLPPPPFLVCADSAYNRLLLPYWTAHAFSSIAANACLPFHLRCAAPFLTPPTAFGFTTGACHCRWFHSAWHRHHAAPGRFHCHYCHAFLLVYHYLHTFCVSTYRTVYLQFTYRCMVALPPPHRTELFCHAARGRFHAAHAHLHPFRV